MRDYVKYLIVDSSLVEGMISLCCESRLDTVRKSLDGKKSLLKYVDTSSIECPDVCKRHRFSHDTEPLLIKQNLELSISLSALPIARGDIDEIPVKPIYRAYTHTEILDVLRGEDWQNV